MKRDKQDRLAFENMYTAYYSRMKRFAQEYVIHAEDAENIVQDIFLELWENKLFLSAHINIFSFLFTAVKNRCIDFLRHQAIVQKTADKLQEEHQKMFQMKQHALELLDEKIFSETDIEKIVQKAIDSLPERCREIFIMNKMEGKKQKDIAETLHISINTVESQMAIAYRKLREALKDYLPLLFLLLG